MAHIVNCMAGAEPACTSSFSTYIATPSSASSLNVDSVSKSCNHFSHNRNIDHIARSLSPQPSTTARTPPASEKPFVWRMQPEARKYQLFPREKSVAKALDPEQAFAMVMGQNSEKADKPSVTTGLRLRIREHSLNRRRKVSVPELGPMTTVQEVAMDSPTIPGRPPLHERSISAPGNAWKQHHLAECMAYEDITEESDSPAAPSFKLPLSPKTLAPLVIPTQQSPTPKLTRELSLNRLRSGSTPAESTRPKPDESPRTRSPFTPLSASINMPKSAVTAATNTAMTASALPTPISAPAESRSSPNPWEKSTVAGGRNTPDPLATPRADSEPRSAPPAGSHRRQLSESGSIMDRGRPKKRSDAANHNGPLLKQSTTKRSRSAERRAFEHLPKGWKGSEAVNMLSPTEMSTIQKQALGQAERFEVLRKEDVDSLSKELRHLDERTDYLRRTYTSLRAGRRNLHSRICQYLRSPRMAKFSQDSILKQEEALAELDASIDDWVNKLERAENRRTRVRQKLLEHVAAAAILPCSNNSGVVGVSQSLQLAMGIPSPSVDMSPGNISTPPRSPTKTTFFSQSPSPSPQRVVAQVPSTILEQPLVEEAAALNPEYRRADVESIRIYADSDVYALFQDVENEITKMSAGDSYKPTPAAAAETKPAEAKSMTEEERKELHRARSHEMLSGITSKQSSASTTPTTATSTVSNAVSQSSAASLPLSPPAPSPPAKDAVEHEVTFFLSSAVFKPEKATAAA